jgi:hypothetical protein
MPGEHSRKANRSSSDTFFNQCGFEAISQLRAISRLRQRHKISNVLLRDGRTAGTQQKYNSIKQTLSTNENVTAVT